MLVAGLAMVLLGAGDDSRARFDKLGHKMMCRCGCNQILLECNHVGCSYSDSMREELIAGLNRGDSDDLILQAFVQKYGTTVLAAPTTSGFNVVAWIMPFVALTVGLMLVAVVVRVWKNRALPVASGGISVAELDDYKRRAHEETQV
jgi:cytochrome c-type biogenesis protein CcmH